MKYNNKIRLFDSNNMSCFCDGSSYSIDNEYVDMSEDINNDIPENLLLKFAKEVKNFKSDYELELVYIKKYKYYIIAIIGYNDDELDWNDDMEKTRDELIIHLKNNRIEFC